MVLLHKSCFYFVVWLQVLLIPCVPDKVLECWQVYTKSRWYLSTDAKESNGKSAQHAFFEIKKKTQSTLKNQEQDKRPVLEISCSSFPNPFEADVGQSPSSGLLPLPFCPTARLHRTCGCGQDFPPAPVLGKTFTAKDSGKRWESEV